MAEKFFMFDYNALQDNEYTQIEHSAMFRHGYRSGVCYEQYGENSLLVSDYAGGVVSVSPGVMRIEGFCYELDEEQILHIPDHIPGMARIDYAIIQLNSSKAFGMHAMIKPGEEGTGEPPALIREGHIYEMCIAELYYDGLNVVVTDKRKDVCLCGEYRPSAALRIEDMDEIIKAVLHSQYDIGDIIMTTNTTDPAVKYGGAWQPWGTGQVPVGVDTSQTEFNTVEKVGGAKAQTLTTAQLPSHAHGMTDHNHAGIYGENVSGQGITGSDRCYFHGPDGVLLVSGARGSSGWNFIAGPNSDFDLLIGSAYNLRNTENTGSGGAHNNLQPYITCYYWKKIA